jgi:hypothetical protein
MVVRSTSPGVVQGRAAKRPRAEEVLYNEAERTEAELVEEQMTGGVEAVKSYANELDYRNKLVLAPMVRTGSRKSVRRAGLIH